MTWGYMRYKSKYCNNTQARTNRQPVNSLDMETLSCHFGASFFIVLQVVERCREYEEQLGRTEVLELSHWHISAIRDVCTLLMILKKAPAPSEDHEALQIVFRKFLVHAKTSSREAPGKACWKVCEGTKQTWRPGGYQSPKTTSRRQVA